MFNLDFKVTPLSDAKYLRNGTRYRHSYNGNHNPNPKHYFSNKTYLNPNVDLPPTIIAFLIKKHKKIHRGFCEKQVYKQLAAC